MTYDKKKGTITVGPDTDLTKDLFQHFEEINRRIIAENPNCSPEIIEDYEGLKQANKAVKDFESLKALSELAKANIGLLVEDGLFRVKQLALLSLQDNVSVATKRNWSVIAQSFHCNHELTEANASGIRDALRQYHSREKLGVQPLPAPLSSVFDSLYTSEPKVIRSTSFTGKLALVYQKVQSIPKLSKAGAACMLAWTIYVSYRSYGYHQLLGRDLEQWRGDDFFANLLIAPLSLAALVFVVRWVLGDKK